MRPNFWSSSGLTLLELLVVVCIMGILLTFAFPHYQSMVSQNRVSAAVSDLHSALLYTRSEALKRGGRVVICRSQTSASENPNCASSSGPDGADWSAGWIIFADNDGDRQFSGGDELLQTRGVVFHDRSEGAISTIPRRNQLTFNFTGQIFANYMQFVIHRPLHDQNERHDRYLCLASGGRARVSTDRCK